MDRLSPPPPSLKKNIKMAAKDCDGTVCVQVLHRCLGCRNSARTGQYDPLFCTFAGPVNGVGARQNTD